MCEFFQKSSLITPYILKKLIFFPFFTGYISWFKHFMNYMFAWENYRGISYKVHSYK